MKAILLLFITLLTSCGESAAPKSNYYKYSELQKSETITLNDLGYDIQYVALETTDEVLISGITKVCVSDEYIFTAEYNKLNQFDRKGKFIRNISKLGKGPQEYLMIGNITIDESENLIYIYDFMGKLLKYDFDGNYQRSYPLKKFMFMEFAANKNSALITAFNSYGKKGDLLKEFSFADSSIVAYDSLPAFTLKNNQSSMMHMLSKGVIELGTEYVVHPNMSNKVYTYDQKSKTLTERYKFEFETPFTDIGKGFEGLKETQALGDISEDDNYIFAIIYDKSWSPKLYLIDKKNNKTFKTDFSFIDELETTFRPRFQNSNKLTHIIDLSTLNYINPEELTEEVTNKALEFFGKKTNQKLTLESNPVIVILEKQKN